MARRNRTRSVAQTQDNCRGLVEQACLGLRETRAVPLTEQATSIACPDTSDAALAIPLLESLSR